jgi:hypothetical protein
MRSAAGSMGRTMLALFAVLSLLLSALVMASPAAANHKGFDHQPLPIDTASFDHDADECQGVELGSGQVLLHWVATQQNVTEAIALTLHYAGGGSATVQSSSWNEPALINANVTHHFYLEVSGDVVITDLDLSTGEGNLRLSHVCRGDGEGVAGDAGILIQKVDEDGRRLAGAVFTVEGVSGEFTTGSNGRVCVPNLPQGATLTVTEIQAPPGYLIADPASRQVAVDKDGCDSSPEVTFVNVLDAGAAMDAGILIQKVDENDEPLAGAVFTVEGVSGEFTTGSNGRVCVDGLPRNATLTVTEISAPPGYQLADPASRQVDVDNDGCDGSPEVTFVNTLGEGEQPAEAVTISIMKHLCTGISSVAEFEALEASAGSELEALVATVVACPTVVLSGDVPTTGAISGGSIDFDFSIVDADGTQTLADDGVFMAGAICETDVNLDADGSGTIDADVCLDVSHYQFEVTDGVVVITETQAPAGSAGFGTLRFTPGSGDETALANSLADVEATGVIRLDTSAASEAALEDGIMLHVYNFAAEGEGPGEGELPGQPQQPGEGTLPDTATAPGPIGSVPAALLALVMLTGLGAAAHTMQAEARRRR